MAGSARVLAPMSPPSPGGLPGSPAVLRLTLHLTDGLWHGAQWKGHAFLPSWFWGTWDLPSQEPVPMGSLPLQGAVQKRTYVMHTSDKSVYSSETSKDLNTSPKGKKNPATSQSTEDHIGWQHSSIILVLCRPRLCPSSWNRGVLGRTDPIGPGPLMGDIKAAKAKQT